jgi:cytochrome c oxidase subunit II
VMLYAIWKYRARDDLDDRDGSPVHGHTGLEIFWTAIPAVIVTVFGVWAGIILHDNEAHAATDETLVVHGHQFFWSFDYPRHGVKGLTGDAYLPVNTRIIIRTTGEDVIHDFFVPDWRVKIDTVPGTWSETYVNVKKQGRYLVQCAELCGGGHGPMGLPPSQGGTGSYIFVVSRQKYDAWLAQQRRQQQSQNATPGLATFKSDCGGCHKFTPAKTAGASTYPDLDNLARDAKTAGKPLQDYIRESIVKPNDYITPGFPQGVMPSNFDSTLSKTDIDNLVKLLSGGTS